MAGQDKPTDATESLADVQIGLGEARAAQADGAAREQAGGGPAGNDAGRPKRAAPSPDRATNADD